MKLIVINSNSAGNSYALDAGGEILLLEAGVKMSEVKKAINFRLLDVVGCIVSHRHGDHAKYAAKYAESGVDVYGPKDVEDNIKFPFGRYHTLLDERTRQIGDFFIVPFHNYHDVEIYGYLIRHPKMGTLLFSTDTYVMGLYLTGVDHFLIEANYSDALLKENTWNGSIDKKQADRIMISHLSLDYAVKYLRECKAEQAKTITLCHLSERNSDPIMFQKTVAGAFGVPTYIAQKGLIVELAYGK
jgi:ribonuclease BN (tRNA processing enzyme)